MSTICQAIIVALIAAFIILFLGKTGLRTKFRDFNDEIGISVLADMLDCDFCLSFWTCLVIAIRLCCAINDAGHIVKAGLHDGTHTLQVFANLTNDELQSMVNAELNPETVTLQCIK